MLKLDLSNSGLEEFQQSEFEGYGPKTSKSVSKDISNEVKESSDGPLVKELVSDDKLKKSQCPRENQKNWNSQKSQQLGSDFVIYNKACFVCESFDHLQANYNYNQKERVVSENNYTRVNYNNFTRKTHSGAHRNMAPRAVLMKTGLRPPNTARPVNIAHSKTTVYSAIPMPRAINTTRPNSTVVNAVRKNQINAVKASTCWVWRPTKLNSASITLKKHNYGHPQKEYQGYVDSGCLRHMTRNMSYLSDFKEFNGGHVTFGGGAKGGKITGKGTLKTVPRKNNMYSVDIKNIVPKESLTCLVVKAILNESMLWHRRPGHKGIKKEFSVARTPQQNGIAERRNRTLIKAARTILADFKLPTTFSAEAVNIACYVQNRVLVVKPHNKTSYEQCRCRTPALSFMRPFGCHVTFLNTLDHLGKFDRKSDDGSFVGYSLYSKALRVFNIKTRKVEENLHISDAGIKDDEGVSKESKIGVQERPSINTASRNVNTDRASINTASPNVNTNGPSINTASTNDNAEVDLSKISTTYLVPSTPNTRIHKDYSLDHVISDVQSGVQTRRMTKTTSKQGLISVVYKGKTHKDLHTSLFACFLSQEEPKKIYKNKKDERGIMVRNKARLVAQGHTQEEGIYYDEVFAPIARIEAIRLFLAYASFKDFVVYQMDVKSAFLYDRIEKEVYVCQPPGFKDPKFPDKVYKVEKVLYGLHQAPRACYKTLSTYLLDNGFHRANTPMETSNPLLKDENAEDVDVHLYRSMIGSLMYLTSSRPDIMFAVCACARFQVTPKVSHLHAVKRIFRYLKGQSKLGLWYPKDSPFDLEAYTNSDYAGQTRVANSTTKAEYVVASNCCGQLLWIQNQMLDYGYNFMNTKIFIDNESTIFIVKNPVFHSKTKHVEIRHHFIRDSNEKKLIQMIKIHTDQNVTDLLTKAFDVGIVQYLIASIGMVNL
uniref:Putative ribonuclease H-like domain-containing protein n=1 Tax=Tanacetum cinerariifolium TaxID=118510 RepID=A0A6L2MDW0_TANCI|nr:putative ribonuclease H-like domain-containing protein [Tanacetum cinerariifolium]